MSQIFVICGRFSVSASIWKHLRLKCIKCFTIVILSLLLVNKHVVSGFHGSKTARRQKVLEDTKMKKNWQDHQKNVERRLFAWIQLIEGEKLKGFLHRIVTRCKMGPSAENHGRYSNYVSMLMLKKFINSHLSKPIETTTNCYRTQLMCFSLELKNKRPQYYERHN